MDPEHCFLGRLNTIYAESDYTSTLLHNKLHIWYGVKAIYTWEILKKYWCTPIIFHCKKSNPSFVLGLSRSVCGAVRFRIRNDQKGRIRIPDTGSRLFTYGNKKVAGSTASSEKRVWEEREEQQDSAYQPPAPTTLFT
jgi:hypothetical protein